MTAHISCDAGTPLLATTQALVNFSCSLLHPRPILPGREFLLHSSRPRRTSIYPPRACLSSPAPPPRRSKRRVAAVCRSPAAPLLHSSPAAPPTPNESRPRQPRARGRRGGPGGRSSGPSLVLVEDEAAVGAAEAERVGHDALDRPVLPAGEQLHAFRLLDGVLEVGTLGEEVVVEHDERV